MYRLSVIIPMYNVEDYIDETIQSVLIQSTPEIEIICVDDGSTDQTVECIQPYLNHGGIRMLSQENLGVSAARNRGIRASNAEYIFFLDGDDLMEPYCIKTFLENKFTPDLIVGNRYYLEKEKVPASNYKNSKSNFYEFLMYSINKKIIYWNIGGYIVKKNLLLENEIYFPEGYTSAEDLDFFMQLLIVNPEIETTEIYLFSYRRNREGSAVQNCTFSKIRNQIEIYQKYFNYFDEYPVLKQYFHQSVVRSITQISYLNDTKTRDITKRYVKYVVNNMDYKDLRTKIYCVYWRIFGFYTGSKMINYTKKRIKLKHQ